MIEAVSPHFAKPMLPAGAVGLRVLSLFDGMSCGQQALERIGVNVLEYYASEIDKHAIACYDMGFDLTGYEIDKEYYTKACKRIETHKMQLTIW